MQINGLLSMLMNLPSANAGASLLGGADLFNNGQTTGNQVGFSGLLGADSQNPNAKNSLLKDNTPPGDITPTPQVSNIAIPPIPMYIDQPIEQNGVQVAGTNLIANDASKNFANFINNPKPIASELKNNQEFIPHNKLATPNANNADNSAIANENTDGGQLDLSSLNLKPADAKSQVTPEEFQTALANIEQFANKKNEGKPELYSNVKVTSAKEVKVSDRTELNDKFAKTAQAEQNLENKAFDDSKKAASNIIDKLHENKVAAKPVANILAKDEVITENKGNAKIEDNFAAKLQEINSQIKATHTTEAKFEEIANKSATDQVQIKISQAAANGLDSIKIKLQPAELGAVDVEMKVDNAGNTQIRIIAERAETLEMLRKDSHALSQSLNDAGIKTNTGGLEFSLRGGNQQQFAQYQEQGFGHNHGNHYGRNDAYGYNNKSSNVDREYTINMAQNQGLNIFA